ncbi:MAG: TSUP family transporter [Chitinivibrionales bacterium]|nr:TSUP family transporter [Chitinivibrionales bacterium]
MEPFQVVAAVVIVCLAGMAQSAVGFGYALFATPPLVMIGLPLPNVIALISTCSLLQAIIGVRRLRGSVPWRLSLTAMGVRLAGVIVGLFLLRELVALSAEQVRLVVGCVLCVLVGIQLIWRPRPVQSMHWAWGGLAFACSGLLAGFCGMGGPPLVLWSMAHDWPTRKTRGFLFGVFATAIPTQLALLWLTFGTPVLKYTAIGVAMLPLVYLGAMVGLPIGNRLGRTRLRRIAYVILLALGISAVAPAFVHRSVPREIRATEGDTAGHHSPINTAR